MSRLTRLAEIRDFAHSASRELWDIIDSANEDIKGLYVANSISGEFSEDIDDMESFLALLDDLRRDLLNVHTEVCGAMMYAERM